MEEIPGDIQALVRERRKIEAIKALRERTGLGLKEAKDRIDFLERELGIAPARSSLVGALVFWCLLIVVGLLIWWFSSRFQHS